ncbi:MAG: hypothetical protein M5U08_13975 [Burkholderiales bacterium]|nr:hypothetical protein [Burkholderiales bacterium]
MPGFFWVHPADHPVRGLGSAGAPRPATTPVAEGALLRWATHLILPVFTLVSG